jgi:hypothetical protein
VGRNSVWVDYEIDAVVSAIIAGRTDEEICALVQALVGQRSAAATAAAAGGAR